ncbi:histidine kinase [Actinomadura rubrobrunea]|uniref:histidine kinase n=1 Tax=Actinomadura rubrobrunea TaxID=115335 RepID=A0A9W6PZH9_9ACTN|nr:ATP-binding protein [Actinomadura rubrobrunea]GLW66772.1 histidine kinase [Actinomadura rubrobrunea]
MTDTAEIPPERLRGLFLFEGLDDEKLAWLAEHGSVREHARGEVICAEGDAAEFLYVLLDGELVMTTAVRGGDQVEMTRGDRPGLYGGAVQAYLGDRIDQRYRHTLRAGRRPTTVFALPARKFGKAVRDWFPMATHLLEGVFFGTDHMRRLVDQRERLTALGTITAGLTHELNNLGVAAARASAELGDRLAGGHRRLAELAAAGVDCRRLADLVSLHERLRGRGAGEAAEPGRDPLEVSDAEDELADWLEGHGVEDAWELSPGLVAAGLGVAEIEQVAPVAGAQLPVAARWLAEMLEVAQLQAELADATGRMTALLDSAKQYSQLDRAPYRRVDLRELLKSTLVMLKRKVPPGVRVVKDFAPDLPPVPVYAAELNQVWTNLIVNALDAMGDAGVLTVRTARRGDHALVEIGDTGPGIPEENLPRIFTPFFTTKPVGEGTGLGLDISWRIVVDRHRGDIRVESRPGDTRVQVLLPLTEPAAVDAADAEEGAAAPG